jgi:hypothetical protein
LFVSPASFTAIFNLFPVFFPFFSPVKWFFTNCTIFYWQMLFFQLLYFYDSINHTVKNEPMKWCN